MAILLIAYGHILPKLFEFFKLNIEIAQNIFDCFWDIAENMGFKKSSVSVAMKHLREDDYITVTKPGFIYLTDKGREVAEMIYERHELLTSWLIQLGVDENVAAEDACRMEHDISKESFEAIKKYILDNN